MIARLFNEHQIVFESACIFKATYSSPTALSMRAITLKDFLNSWIPSPWHDTVHDFKSVRQFMELSWFYHIRVLFYPVMVVSQ